MNKIVDGIKETVKEYLELLDDSIPIANYHMGSVTGLSQEIYNNRKKLGLFTLDDIEIDEKAIIRVMKELYNANPNSGVSFPNIAKAIATKKPIKIKEEWYATQRS